ncbi:MAG: hypothetical protein KF830_05635 [Planctomycetes bacterium]|nr:hypothetical protein [Planctomycetota bacterium]
MNPRPCLALALLGLAPFAAAQTSVLPYLPKDTIVAVSAPDLATSLEEFRKMPVAKMWAEEEVQNFVADLHQMVEAQFQQVLKQGKDMHAQGQLPVDPDELLKLRLRGATIALTHLELTMGDFGPQPKVGILLHLDFGATAPQWHALVQLGLGMLEGRAGAAMSKSVTKVGEWPLATYAANDVQDSPMALSVLTLPDGILVGTLVDDVQATATNLQQKNAVLASSAAFGAAAKQLKTEGSELVAFVRYDPMVDFVLSLLRMGTEMSEELAMIDMDGVERALSAMGCKNLPTEMSTSHYVEGKCWSQTFRSQASDAATSTAKAIDMGFLKWVPKDAVSFGASSIDMMGIHDMLLKGLQAYDKDLADQLLAQLAEMEKQVGFRVRDDLFGSVGDHYVTWSMPVGTIASAPEMALLLKVNDPERIVKVLTSLAKLSDGQFEVEKSEKRGIEVYQLRINFDPTQGRGGMNPLEMFTPTFAFKGGYLVGGFSASDIKRVFQRMDREDDPKGDIRSNREFAAVANRIPSGVDSVSFTDWKASFESIYQIATSLLAFVPMGEEVPLDMSLLPDAATLTKHLFGAVSFGRVVPGGYQSESISPFGPEVTILVGALAGAGATVFGMTQSGGF